MEPAPEREFEKLFERRLDDERLRGLGWANSLRVAAVGAQWLIAVFGWQVQGSREYLLRFPYVTAYFAAALGLWVLGRWSPRFLARSGLAVVALDMPMVFAGQLMGMQDSAIVNPVRGFYGVDMAAFTFGVFMALIIVAQITLDRAIIFVAAVVAIGLQVALLTLSGLKDPDWSVNTAVLAIMGGVIAAYTVERFRTLVRSVSAEHAARERLGRYFSPAVAGQIVSRGTGASRGELREVTVLFSRHPRLHRAERGEDEHEGRDDCSTSTSS